MKLKSLAKNTFTKVNAKINAATGNIMVFLIIRIDLPDWTEGTAPEEQRVPVFFGRPEPGTGAVRHPLPAFFYREYRLAVSVPPFFRNTARGQPGL